jgi:hypothetical protein
MTHVVRPASHAILHPPRLQWLLLLSSDGHALLQLLQLLGSDCRFTHALPQSVSPGGHAALQLPAEQVCPPLQCTPQVPQYCGSVCRLTHALPPFVGAHVAGVAALQVTPQAPLEHAGAPVDAPETGPEHALVQLPQWATSVFSLKQPDGHWFGKLVDWHVKPQLPIEHTAVPFEGGEHALPHAPQFDVSVCVSTQALPHFVKPAMQVKSHDPALQTGTPFAGGVHTVPQDPQWLGSVCWFTHAPLHALKPASHTKPQVDAEQVAVLCAGAVHTCPQAAQFWVSLVVSTQLPPQLVWPIGHETMHVPPAQTWFMPQAVPHAPQLLLSVCVFTQAPLHAV